MGDTFGAHSSNQRACVAGERDVEVSWGCFREIGPQLEVQLRSTSRKLIWLPLCSNWAFKRVVYIQQKHKARQKFSTAKPCE